MIHILLLFAGALLVIQGVVICALFCRMIVKGTGPIRWIAAAGVFIVAALAINFSGHMLHLRHPMFPHQKQIVGAINSTLQWAMIPLLLLKFYEAWAKKRRQVANQPQGTMP